MLVAGGGVAGLAIARAIRNRGIRAVVVERAARTSAPGLAINLAGNGVAAFAHLGLSDRLNKVGQPTRRREYRSSGGTLLFEINEDEFWGPHARPRCVRRSDLLAMLDMQHDDTRRSAAVESVRPRDGGAEVTFVGGQVERYGFVVGADGVRSVVRGSVFPGHRSRAAVVSTAAFRIMAPNPGLDCYTMWSGAGSTFLLIPVDGDEVYAFASATGGGQVDADPSWLDRTFVDYPEPVKAVLAYARHHREVLHHSPIEEVRTDEWSRGRVALIGDAAHATAPVWAQGAALAVEDALALAKVLSEGDWDTAGVRYQQRRRERVQHVQVMTDRFSQALALPANVRERNMAIAGPKAYHEVFGPLRDGRAWR
ncbi:NAD(P)/FAD-dependent oxidoreductase [Actinoplanes sp. TBRC 11911]|uniref:NAD(P)/FAD-dependent oxidoreductase n=1 Tax=Actinoplanes sp. TBRC 11911 TaxID=2729386 RepID=UPI0028983023|nr:NAD(P)/FAD-dependent oxidoreductase [Actinoplanes sp. TBRC 11911]